MNLGTPLHRKVFLIVVDGIATGKYAEGDMLPSEDALAKLFNVSRVTIRRALVDLASAGLVEKRHGRGTFIRSSRPAAELFPINRLKNYIAKAGELQVRIMEFETMTPSRQISDLLKVEPGSEVQRAVRVRYKGKQPVMHLTTFVPNPVGRLISKDDLAKTPLYELLARLGKAYQRAEQTVSACLADPIVAPLLNVEIGTALLLVRRLLYSGDDPVEYLEIRAAPAEYEIMMAWDTSSDIANGIGKVVEYDTRI